MKNLKVIFSSLLFVFLFSTHAISQNLAIRGGVNLATITGEANFGQKENLIGLNVALSTEAELSNSVSLQPELHFVQKGVVSTTNVLTFSTKTSTIINYIEIPVLVKANFNGGYLLLGPSYDLALSGKVIREVEGNRNESTLNKDNISTGNLGLQVGVGFEFEKVLIDVRFGRGFGDNYQINDDEANVNQGFRLTLGYKL